MPYCHVCGVKHRRCNLGMGGAFSQPSVIIFKNEKFSKCAMFIVAFS